MTVTYTAKVATSSIGCFLKLLLRWRGSVYKLLWRELLIFIALYYILAFVYRFALPETGKRHFEMVARYCEMYNNLIPLAFVLGFYVSVVLTRWWEQFNHIPWPDTMALFISASIQGQDERGRLMRRTIMRYLCLSYVITMSSISPAVKKRFPTFQHMTDAGFMLANEQTVMESVQTQHNKYFIPLVWSTSLITRARKEGRIKDDYAVKTLIDELNTYRGRLGSLFNYDWISVPLVYTQVVTLAVYTFFLSCLMGRQFVSPPNRDTTDIYVPVFTLLQFMFYMGWLKVAETLVNPFGEDDDDFDINIVIDRNLQVSYLVVDEMHQEHPELIKDAYWDEVDFELPYTVASEPYRASSPFLGSAMDISLNQRQAEFVGLTSIPENLNETDSIGSVQAAQPTDIPLVRRSRRSPLISSRTGNRPMFNRLKRSTSRQKSDNTEKDSITSSTNHLRQDSVTSKDSEGRAGSPPLGQDEIFPMDDLVDSEAEEPELNLLKESITSQGSHLIDLPAGDLPREVENLREHEMALLGDSAAKGGPIKRRKSREGGSKKEAPVLKPLGVKPTGGVAHAGSSRSISGKKDKETSSLPATPVVSPPKDLPSQGPPKDSTVSMVNVPTPTDSVC